jgi:antitoxin component YwqK of YwqJK toxin-antitoxin module
MKMILTFALFLGILMTGTAQSLEVAREEGHRTLYTYENGLIAFQTLDALDRVVETGFFLDGRPHGNWVRYDENGEITAQASYIFGNKEGRWMVWNHDRTVLFEINYEGNNKVSATKWRADERIAMVND